MCIQSHIGKIQEEKAGTGAGAEAGAGAGAGLLPSPAMRDCDGRRLVLLRLGAWPPNEVLYSLSYECPIGSVLDLSSSLGCRL